MDQRSWWGLARWFWPKLSHQATERNQPELHYLNAWLRLDDLLLRELVWYQQESLQHGSWLPHLCKRVTWAGKKPSHTPPPCPVHQESITKHSPHSWKGGGGSTVLKEGRSKNLWAYFFFKFFKMWTIFKVFIESVSFASCFSSWLRHMWNCSSLTRDQTCTCPCPGRWSPNRLTTGDIPVDFNKYHHYCWGPGTLHSVRNAFLSLFGLVDSAINQWVFFFFFF